MRIEIKSENDILSSRSAVKELAREIGFGIVDQTKIATSISELTRNVIKYAKEGSLKIKPIIEGGRKGIEIICEDKGPGIKNIEDRLDKGGSTSGGLGLGLTGAKRLMDEFKIESKDGKGTKIMVIKWL